MIERISYTMAVKVKLDKEEIRIKGEELSRKIIEKHRLEDDRDTAKRHWKTRISMVQEEIDDLVRTVDTGIEMRDLEVKDELDPLEKKILTYVVSTGELVKERSATDDDLQERFA